MKHLEIHVMNQINREEVRILRGQKNLSSWEYKLLLTRKGNEIREAIDAKRNEIYGCDNCNDPNIPLPNKFKQNCSVNGCRIDLVNENGIGLN